MKKIIAILAVVALTASCFASTITITAATSGTADTVVISYSASAVPVGASMKLSLTSGDCKIAAAADVNNGITPPLQVYVDYAYSNGTTGMNTYGVKAGAHPVALATGPGVATFPATLPVALCMGNLGPSAAPLSGTLAKIKFTKNTSATAALHIAADTANRGGFVDATGAVMTPTFPADVNLAFGGCATCLGDVNGDHKVNAADITAIVNLLTPRTVPPYTPPAYTIPSTDPAYAANRCADYNNDNKINAADITAIVNLLTPRTVPPFTPPAYTFPCP